MKQKDCDVCGGTFTPTGRNQKRCSWACSRQHRNRWAPGSRIRACIICTAEFNITVHNQAICSKKCVRRYRTQWMARWNKAQPKSLRPAVCEVCFGSFFNHGKSERKTCSRECQRLSQNARHRRYAKSPKCKSRMKGYRSTPEYRLYHMLRSSLSSRVRSLGPVDAPRLRTAQYVSYTRAQLMDHLEKQFRPGMSWDSYGLRGWHVDHIKPLCKFKFFTDDGQVRVPEVRKAVALKNLQPLWAADNLSKGGR